MIKIEDHEHWLDDLENRMRYQENLHTPSDSSLEGEDVTVIDYLPLTKEPSLDTQHLQNQIDQIKAKMNQLQNDLNGHIDPEKRNEGKRVVYR